MGIPVSVACAHGENSVWLKLEMEEGATVQDTVIRANLPRAFPGFTLEGRNFGIFGKLVTPETPINAGDRIEVYQPAA